MNRSLPLKNPGKPGKIAAIVRFALTGLILLWGLSLTVSAQATFYTFKDLEQWDGNWHNPESWTDDPTGSDTTDEPVIPTDNSIVHILPGTTVRLFEAVTQTGLSIHIDEGGRLILGSFEIAQLLNLSGKGELIIDRTWFPQITGSNSFSEPEGGTLIFRLAGSSLQLMPSNLHQAHNLTLMARPAAAFSLRLGQNLTVHGDLRLVRQEPNQGHINLSLGTQASPISLQVKNNLYVEKGMSLRVSPFNATHDVRVGGDMLADGNVTLWINNSRNAIFTFTGAEDNTLSGTSDSLNFHRLIIDKGTDQTFILEIAHPSLKLSGPTNLSNLGQDSDPNPEIRKALWIRNGTLKLNHPDIFIPELSSGGNDFFIPANGQLWVAAGEVHSKINNTSNQGNTGFTVIGTLRISGDAIVRGNRSAGIVYRGNARVIVEDNAQLHIRQFRPSSYGSIHQAGWEQHGGKVFVGQNPGENNDNHPRFGLPLPSHSFTMSGGELHIFEPNTNNRGLAIGVSEGNHAVTGGSVFLYIPNDRNFGLSTTSPLFELNLLKQGSTARQLELTMNYSFASHSIQPQPLRVLSHLVLEPNAVLHTQGRDLSIGGNFILRGGASYIPSGNTTEFFYHNNGGEAVAAQVVVENNTTAQFLKFHHLVFNKNNPAFANAGHPSKNIVFSSPGRTTDPTAPASYLIEVTGNITHRVARSQIQVGNFGIVAKGNITIEDHPTTQSIQWVNTRLLLNGSSPQLLYIRGWYTFGPGRVILDNAQGAQLMENTNLGNNILELRNGNLHLGSNLLALNNRPEGNFGPTRMITTHGLPGDGGLRLRIRVSHATHTTTQFVFPLGTGTKYTPLKVSVLGTGNSTNNPWLRVNPVNTAHPGVSGNKVLKYYWKTEANLDNSNINSFTIAYTFQYDQSDVNGNENQYRSATLSTDNGSWVTGDNNSVNSSTNQILFPGHTLRSTDYTAGENSEFQGQGHLAHVFVSKNDGSGPWYWNDANSWTRIVGPANKNFPEAGSIAIIQEGHTISIRRNEERAESVQISQGATLDQSIFTGHVFQTVTGSGKLRLSSPALPKNSQNQYSINNFHFTDGGIIEYYGNEALLLPADFPTYRNLNIHGSGQKILPVGTVTINGTLRILEHGTLSTNPSGSGELNVHGTTVFNRDTPYGTIINSILLANGPAWTLNFYGAIDYWESAQIRVEDGSGATKNHTVNIRANLSQGRGRMDLWGNGINTATLGVYSNQSLGFGTGQYGGAWKVNRLVVNLAAAHHTLRIDRLFEIKGSTHGSTKALEMVRGRLVLGQRSNEHPNIKDITLSSGGGNFVIPVDASLQVEGRNIVRTTAATDILLNGSLTVSGNGKVLLGYTEDENASPAASSHILFSTSGRSRLEIHQQGRMFVSGQVRRPGNTSSGILHYVQTGESQFMATTLAPTQTDRAAFEIPGESSSFALSHPASFVLVNGLGTLQETLLMETSQAEVTGTITLGATDKTLANQHFGIRSSAPLHSVVVSGYNSPQAYLHTFPLDLRSADTSLKLETGSRLRMGSLNLSCAGSIINNGELEAEADAVLLFDGFQEQWITGSGQTLLQHWFVDNATGASLGKNLLVQKTLRQNGGNLNDHGNTITLLGDADISGNHISPALSGGLLFAGTGNQNLIITGEAGRLSIQKASGQVVAGAALNVAGSLQLENGILNMGFHRLVIRQQATLSSSEGFGVQRMIMTAGTLGDGGLRRYFTGHETGITFPLGVLQNGTPAYTPLVISNITEVAAQRFMEVYPVRGPHPNISAQGNPNRVLQYYWGLITDFDTQDQFSGDLAFTYLSPEHVLGNINLYFTAQLRPGENDTWAKIDGNDPENPTIDKVNHRIIFQPRNAGANIINGFYTAGEENAIPSDVAQYNAMVSGDWDEPGTWQDNEVPPSGVVIYIPEGVELRIETNRKRVYKTIVDGHLKINPSTTFHNLGIVEGRGTIELKGRGPDADGNLVLINLPPGRYDNPPTGFMLNPQSTLIFSGEAGLLPTNITRYQNLVIAGSGVKQLPEINITTNNLTIDPGAIFGMQKDETNRILAIQGDFVMDQNSTVLTGNRQNIDFYGISIVKAASAVFNAEHVNRLRLYGNHPQHIYGTFNTFGDRFNNFYVYKNRNSPVYLHGDVSIRTFLILSNGSNIIIPDNEHTLSLSDANPLHTISNGSFISGRLRRNITAASTSGLFPIGKDNKIRYVTLLTPSSGLWTAEYLNSNPNSAGFNTGLRDTQLQNVSQQEYWRIVGPSPGSARVQLHYGPQSMVDNTPEHLLTTSVAEWDGTKWNNRGGPATAQGEESGYVTASMTSSFSTKYFTIGSTSDHNPLPIELLSFTGKAHQEAILLEWVTAAEINNHFFTLERSFNGRDFHIVAVVASQAEYGFSNQNLYYSNLDLQPREGMNYYRLKQTDFDGSYEYSKVIGVLYQQQQQVSFSLFPNPNRGNSFSIALSQLRPFEQVELQITDLNGRSYHNIRYQADNAGMLSAYLIPPYRLPAGIYLVTVSGTSGRFVVRMVVN